MLVYMGHKDLMNTESFKHASPVNQLFRRMRLLSRQEAQGNEWMKDLASDLFHLLAFSCSFFFSFEIVLNLTTISSAIKMLGYAPTVSVRGFHASKSIPYLESNMREGEPTFFFVIQIV